MPHSPRDTAIRSGNATHPRAGDAVGVPGGLTFTDGPGGPGVGRRLDRSHNRVQADERLAVRSVVGGWIVSDGRRLATTGRESRGLDEILGILAEDGWELTAASDTRLEFRRRGPPATPR